MWINVISFTILHIIYIYGVYLVITVAYWKTFFFYYFLLFVCGLGITAGAHRLWSHKTYKAKLPLRILLTVLHTSGFQQPLFNWVRDHRVHHKFTDTNADPHNASRGFFFSHMGWLMLKKHDQVTKKGNCLDISDLLEDPVVMFQKKYYYYFAPFFTFILPSLVPWYFWNEQFYVALVLSFVRLTLSLHGTWSVNSVAHIWGIKPYDLTMRPTQNAFVSFFTYGEGWHNYHHCFPWDYKTSEWGNYGLNWTTAFIDFMAIIGWAYDLKTASPEMVKRRMERTGVLSHVDPRGISDKSDDVEIWGWGDRDMNREEINEAKVYNQLKDE